MRALEIVPSRGGVFDVAVDDEVVFSKQELGRHAHPGEVMKILKMRAH